MKNSKNNVSKSIQSIDSDWTPRIHEEVLFMEQTTGEFIVFKTSAIDQQFKIDGFAATLWKNIDGENSLQDFYKISDELTEVNSEDLKPQIHQFFIDLKAMGLIEN